VTGLTALITPAHSANPGPGRTCLLQIPRTVRGATSPVRHARAVRPDLWPRCRRAHQGATVTDHPSTVANGLRVICSLIVAGPRPRVTSPFRGSRMEKIRRKPEWAPARHMVFLCPKQGYADRGNSHGRPRAARDELNVTTSFDRKNISKKRSRHRRKSRIGVGMRKADRMVNSKVAPYGARTEMTVVRNEMEMARKTTVRVIASATQAAGFDAQLRQEHDRGAQRFERVDHWTLQVFYRLLLPARQRGDGYIPRLRPDKALALVTNSISVRSETGLATLPKLYTDEPVQRRRAGRSCAAVSPARKALAMVHPVPGARIRIGGARSRRQTIQWHCRPVDAVQVAGRSHSKVGRRTTTHTGFDPRPRDVLVQVARKRIRSKRRASRELQYEGT